jgi:hypothetical protein
MSDNYDPLASMTSSTHKSRGSCCKSGCIHCPYGYTVKKFGLKFEDVTESNKEPVMLLINNKLNIEEFPLCDYKIVTLKDIECAVIRVDKLFVREMIIREGFNEQGISKELVESYYFY